MTTIRVLSAFALTMGCLLSAARADGPEEAALLNIERGFALAWTNADVAFIGEHEADEFVFTNSDGALSAKADDLASLKSGSTRLESQSVDDMRAIVFGDSAVVVGRLTSKGTYLGKDLSGVYRFTDTFVKRDGRWQVVASQANRVQ